MPELLELAQLVERNRVAQVQVRRRRIAAVLDAQRRALLRGARRAPPPRPDRRSGRGSARARRRPTGSRRRQAQQDAIRDDHVHAHVPRILWQLVDHAIVVTDSHEPRIRPAARQQPVVVAAPAPEPPARAVEAQGRARRTRRPPPTGTRSALAGSGASSSSGPTTTGYTTRTASRATGVRHRLERNLVADRRVERDRARARELGQPREARLRSRRSRRSARPQAPCLGAQRGLLLRARPRSGRVDQVDQRLDPRAGHRDHVALAQQLARDVERRQHRRVLRIGRRAPHLAQHAVDVGRDGLEVLRIRVASERGTRARGS